MQFFMDGLLPELSKYSDPCQDLNLRFGWDIHHPCALAPSVKERIMSNGCSSMPYTHTWNSTALRCVAVKEAAIAQ